MGCATRAAPPVDTPVMAVLATDATGATPPSGEKNKTTDNIEEEDPVMFRITRAVESEANDRTTC